MRPSKKDLVAWLLPINHSNFFWNTLQPVFNSNKIAFNLDFVVTVSYPQDESFNAFVVWSRVAMLWPCSKTWLQLVDSLKVTVVLDPDQFDLLERAKFICFSSFLINALFVDYSIIITDFRDNRGKSGHFANWHKKWVEFPH